MRLVWLRVLIYSIGIIIILSAIESMLPGETASFYKELYFISVSLLTLLLLNFIFYRGLQYPEIFQDVLVQSSNQKYLQSNLDEPSSNRILNDLDRYMENNKPYFDDQLTISDLAQKINTSPKYLSQVINEFKEKNFYEFINGYRVKEACTLLNTYPSSELRINEIMYRVGFSSKSTFNQVFKSMTGMTPKEFRNSN